MITCALLDMLTALLVGLYALLPDWSLDIGAVIGSTSADIPDLQYTVTSGQDSLTMMLVWLQKYNNFLPVAEVFLMISALAALVAVVLAYKGVRYIVAVVRGSGT
jgi:hypothetical protein